MLLFYREGSPGAGGNLGLPAILPGSANWVLRFHYVGRGEGVEGRVAHAVSQES